MNEQKSFSKQYGNWVFVFYPKAWTMPSMAIRHVHTGLPRNTFAIDKDGRCTTYTNVTPLIRCDARVTEDLKKQVIHDHLGLDNGVPEWFTETVTFKTPNIVTKLAPDWFVRRYNNQYTKDVERWVFYHDCLRKSGTVAGDTFYKGLFDFMMPYLDKPWACQVCGAVIPPGLKMVSQLTKANIKI